MDIVPAQTLTEARDELALDQYLIEGVLFSYIDDLEEKDPAQAKLLRERIDCEDAFDQQARQSAHEAMVFSTFASTLKDDAYVQSLQGLEPTGDELLDRLRMDIFVIGVQVATESMEGAVDARRLERRTQRFKAAAVAELVT